MTLLVNTIIEGGASITIQQIDPKLYLVSYLDGPDSEMWEEETWADAFRTYANCLDSLFEAELNIQVEAHR